MKKKQIPDAASLLSQTKPTGSSDFAGKPVETPAWIIDEPLLEDNLRHLADLAATADIKIIAAQKAFSLYDFYPLIDKYLAGTTASGLYEARLAHEESKGEIHVYSPYYTREDLAELFTYADVIIFNSLNEWLRWRDDFKKARKKRPELRSGLRFNPQFSAVEHDIYNPAGRYSRLGITAAAYEEEAREAGLSPAELNEVTGEFDGIHIHCLCEENADSLAAVLQAAEERIKKDSPALAAYKPGFINIGGGHHFTRRDYDSELFLKIIQAIKNRYPACQIYAEPGEAVSLDAGFLISEVRSAIKNERDILIMDTSATCHMPDVLEMPYTPRVFTASDKVFGKIYASSAEAGPAEQFLYRIAGPTCLAGDIIGDYIFPRRIEVGEKLLFCDMAIYSHVKANTFNGCPLPHIYRLDEKGNLQMIRRADYKDFKSRLGKLE